MLFDCDLNAAGRAKGALIIFFHDKLNNYLFYTSSHPLISSIAPPRPLAFDVFALNGGGGFRRIRVRPGGGPSLRPEEDSPPCIFSSPVAAGPALPGEAKDKLGQMWDENSELKNSNTESMQSLQQMMNDAIRSRASTEASLQESLQLLEQQKRIDIKRKGEISKLEQTVKILKSKER